MEETVMMVIEYLVRAIIIVLGPFVLAFVQSKIKETQMDRIKQWAVLAVEAAEKLFTEEQRVEKKQYVKNFALDELNKIPFINLTEKELDILIEGAVYEVKKLK